MSKQPEMKPGKNGYKIYFNTNTVVMNYRAPLKTTLLRFGRIFCPNNAF